MQDLTITLIQSNLEWENHNANQNHLENIIENLDANTDLIILPEMFSTGFSMQAQTLSQSMTGETVRWLQEISLRKKVSITGSIIIEENGKYYNRLIWVTPQKKIFTYNKKHLFRYAGEERIYAPGDAHLTLTLKGWRIRPFICYDLRFPIWTRNLNNAYDLALFVANWPAKRAAHWRLLLAARAVENQCYIAGVNRLGKDGNQLTYSGDSIVVSYEGEILFDAKDKEVAASIELSSEKLKTYRHEFPAWMDADHELVKLNRV